MMSSNIFINYALTGMNFAYKVMGTRLTNLLINKTAGEVFTSGTSIQTLLKDITALEKRNVNGVANYVLEGIEH